MKSGEIAELARAERETWIVSVLARVGVRECRQQQRASMCAHVQPVGDERNRAEQQAADNFCNHHCAAEPNDRPSLALAFFVPFAEEHMAVRRHRAVCAVHGRPHFK